MSIRVEIRVTLACLLCCDPFEVSARYARGIRSGQYPQKCRPCAKGAPRKPYEELCARQAETRGPVTDRERRWCLEHFTDEEICEIAELIAGGPADIETVRLWREKLEIVSPLAIAAA